MGVVDGSSLSSWRANEGSPRAPLAGGYIEAPEPGQRRHQRTPPPRWPSNPTIGSSRWASAPATSSVARPVGTRVPSLGSISLPTWSRFRTTFCPTDSSRASRAALCERGESPVRRTGSPRPAQRTPSTSGPIPAVPLDELWRVLRVGGRLVLSFSPQVTTQKLPVTKHGFTLYAPGTRPVACSRPPDSAASRRFQVPAREGNSCVRSDET